MAIATTEDERRQRSRRPLRKLADEQRGAPVGVHGLTFAVLQPARVVIARPRPAALWGEEHARLGTRQGRDR
jgi:hypothetical protein